MKMKLMPLPNKSKADSDLVDWELLPKDTLHEILLKLNHREDWRMFMYVCRTWRDMVISNKHKFLRLSRPRVPVLLVPNLEKSKKNDTWSVYNVTDNKLLKSDLILPPYQLPLAGSSEGWIGIVSRKLQVILYKPFDKKIKMLRLPPFTFTDRSKVKYRDSWLMKFVTSTPDPIMNPNDFICVAIFGSIDQLAYIRPNKDKKWTLVSSIGNFIDVVHHNGQFYAVTCDGIVLSFYLTDTSEVITKLVSLDAPADNVYDEDEYSENEEQSVSLYKNYLVESKDGELLHIRRLANLNSLVERNNITIRFVVAKLIYDGGVEKWERLESLGDSALFLGENASISMLVSDGCGYQKNCIYFTHDKESFSIDHRGPWDLGVYNLQTKMVTMRFGLDEAIFAKMGEGRAPIFTLLA